MVENKCSICKKQVEYTVVIRTNNILGHWDRWNEYALEYWCLKCLWTKLPTIAGPEEIPKEEQRDELENCAFGAVTSGPYKTDKKGLEDKLRKAMELCSKPIKEPNNEV